MMRRSSGGTTCCSQPRNFFGRSSDSKTTTLVAVEAAAVAVGPRDSGTGMCWLVAAAVGLGDAWVTADARDDETVATSQVREDTSSRLHGSGCVVVDGGEHDAEDHDPGEDRGNHRCCCFHWWEGSNNLQDLDASGTGR